MSDTPSAIVLHQKTRQLELRYADQASYHLSAEFLRVMSPSAEVKGHSKEQAVLQTGKIKVGIKAVEPVGHYAILLKFDDGHESGIYSWSYLKDLCLRQEDLWLDYLEQLHQADKSRDPDVQVVQLFKPEKPS